MMLMGIPTGHLGFGTGAYLKHDAYRDALWRPDPPPAGRSAAPGSGGLLSPVTVLPEAIQNGSKVEYILP
jgi:hypothetical protein